MTRLSGRHVAVAIGAVVIVLGILEVLSMKPAVMAGNLQNADVMSAVLGIQFFGGLVAIVYSIAAIHSS